LIPTYTPIQLTISHEANHLESENVRQKTKRSLLLAPAHLLVEIPDEAGVPLLVVVWLGWNFSSTAVEKWQLYRFGTRWPNQ
jgi:hypothetical protein